MSPSTQERRARLETLFRGCYRDCPTEWDRLFEQEKFRPRWYKRWWRWIFPKPAVLFGLGKSPEPVVSPGDFDTAALRYKKHERATSSGAPLSGDLDSPNILTNLGDDE